MLEKSKVFENGRNVYSGQGSYRIGESTDTTIEFTRNMIYVRDILPSYALTKSSEYIIDLRDRVAVQRRVKTFQSKTTTEEDFFQCEIKRVRP